MRIIISPAKAMEIDNDDFIHRTMPVFIKDTEEILEYLQGLSYDELKKLWKTSDNLTQVNFKGLGSMDLYDNLTPALISFQGLQYKYMGPGVFTSDELDYIDEHLRILSGFYGILRPFDGVVPYRLEMGARPFNWKYNNIYEFWGHKIAEQIFSETNTIIDLASKEYSRTISKYLTKDIRMIEIVFGELIDRKIIEKATYAKMARGEMVRFMAENQIESEENLKKFKGLGYKFKEEYSNDRKYVFIKEVNLKED